MKLQVTTPIQETPRTAMLRGLFDLPPSTAATEEWDPPDIPAELSTRTWSIGLIHGPSGCGKSTIANALFPLAQRPTYPTGRDATIIDEFPATLPLRDACALLSSVGFSSPPSWLKPFHVLSTGQQFRAQMALTLAAALPGIPVLVDEYTSVIDRTVAQIGSAAIAKTVRRRNLQFIAVTCHDDVLQWLQPDWTYTPAENLFSWRSLRPRPQFPINIVRCKASAWPLFAPHHYLTTDIVPSAICFLATHDNRPVAFSAWLNFFGAGPRSYREHRTVCLPDYQGVGIGNALSDTIASMWLALGFRPLSTTTHPGMIAARNKSDNWIMHRSPSLAKNHGPLRHANTRLTAGFAYCGPAMSPLIAKALHGPK